MFFINLGNAWSFLQMFVVVRCVINGCHLKFSSIIILKITASFHVTIIYSVNFPMFLFVYKNKESVVERERCSENYF